MPCPLRTGNLAAKKKNPLHCFRLAALHSLLSLPAVCCALSLPRLVGRPFLVSPSSSLPLHFIGLYTLWVSLIKPLTCVSADSWMPVRNAASEMFVGFATLKMTAGCIDQLHTDLGPTCCRPRTRQSGRYLQDRSALWGPVYEQLVYGTLILSVRFCLTCRET